MAALYAKTDILAEVRRVLNETTAQFYSDTEINRWIDRAARQVSALTNCESTSTNITLIQNQMMYTVASTNFIDVESVVYNATSPVTGLQRIDIRMLSSAHDGTVGVPKFYYYFAGNVYVWPAPGAGEASGTCTVYGYIPVADYGAAASETLTNEAQYLVVPMVLSSAYTKAGKHSLAGYHMKKFIDDCMVYRHDLANAVKYADSRDMMKIPDYTRVAR